MDRQEHQARVALFKVREPFMLKFEAISEDMLMLYSCQTSKSTQAIEPSPQGDS
jgi:hypothetical protein